MLSQMPASAEDEVALPPFPSANLVSEATSRAAAWEKECLSLREQMESLEIELAAGSHSFAVSFDNDYWEEDEADRSFISEKIITSTKVELIEELEENPQNAEEIAMTGPTDCVFMYMNHGKDLPRPTLSD